VEQPAEGRGPNGVDDTLIEWMLSLTPDERLDVLDDYLRDIEAIRQENAGG
jgi:hypothetical protein